MTPISYTRTVVRECLRVTMQVNGEAQNLTPYHAETPYAGVIKIGRGDYVVDPYRAYTCGRVRQDLPRGFVSAHA